MKQRLLTISVNTRYRVVFACLYWMSGNFMWSGKWSPCCSCMSAISDYDVANTCIVAVIAVAVNLCGRRCCGSHCRGLWPSFLWPSLSLFVDITFVAVIFWPSLLLLSFSRFVAFTFCGRHYLWPSFLLPSLSWFVAIIVFGRDHLWPWLSWFVAVIYMWPSCQ